MGLFNFHKRIAIEERHNVVSHLLYSFQVLGTPTREQIREMNPNYTEFKFPQIKAHPWTKVSQQVQEPFYFSKIHSCNISPCMLCQHALLLLHIH